MAYKKEYPVLNDSGKGSLEEYTKRQEDRIEEGFESTLLTVLKDWNIEWGEVKKKPSSGGYIGVGIEGFMHEPENAILLCNTKGYATRNFNVNGYTVPNNGKLLQFYVTKENGAPADGIEVTVQFAVIYK